MLRFGVDATDLIRVGRISPQPGCQSASLVCQSASLVCQSASLVCQSALVFPPGTPPAKSDCCEWYIPRAPPFPVSYPYRGIYDTERQRK